MITSIFSIVASIAGMLAAWFVGKKVTAWIQAYRDARQKVEEEQTKKDSEALAKKAQEDSDQLKNIEGR